MLIASLIVTGLLGILLLTQAVGGFGMIWAVYRWKPQPLADPQCPKAAIILCLRGSDPFLADCLRGLCTQRYPQYDVRIVVDHPEDPAWAVASRTIRELGAEHVRIEPLAEPEAACSLLCSSLVQAIRGLDDTYQVLALVDADVVAGPDWLRDLVSPLADEHVAVAMGNRWYMPAEASWGALVRYLWNAAAVVQMYWCGYTWGGSLAMKAEVFRDTDLLDRWSRALFHDTLIYAVLRERRWRAQFVPSLLMVNREDCRLAPFYGWMKRQLLNGKLYHPNWPVVLANGIVTSLVPAVALVLAIAAWLAGDRAAAVVAGGGLLAYELIMFPMLAVGEWCVRHVVRGRGEPTRWLTWPAAVKLVFALPLTQLVYAAALCSLRSMRIIDWRGVTYEIESPWRVRLVEYRRYAPAGAEAKSSASL